MTSTFPSKQKVSAPILWQHMHTDPETVSGWTLTTIKANGFLRTFSVVWKSSLINQNLLWGHFWIKLFTSFWVKIWQNMSSTLSQKCPQSRFWFTRELFDTTLKVLRQPLAWVVVKVQPEACSGSVWGGISPILTKFLGKPEDKPFFVGCNFETPLKTLERKYRSEYFISCLQTVIILAKKTYSYHLHDKYKCVCTSAPWYPNIEPCNHI